MSWARAWLSAAHDSFGRHNPRGDEPAVTGVEFEGVALLTLPHLRDHDDALAAPAAEVLEQVLFHVLVDLAAAPAAVERHIDGVNPIVMGDRRVVDPHTPYGRSDLLVSENPIVITQLYPFGNTLPDSSAPPFAMRKIEKLTPHRSIRNASKRFP